MNLPGRMGTTSRLMQVSSVVNLERYCTLLVIDSCQIAARIDLTDERGIANSRHAVGDGTKRNL